MPERVFILNQKTCEPAENMFFRQIPKIYVFWVYLYFYIFLKKTWVFFCLRVQFLCMLCNFVRRIYPRPKKCGLGGARKSNRINAKTRVWGRAYGRRNSMWIFMWIFLFRTGTSKTLTSAPQMAQSRWLAMRHFEEPHLNHFEEPVLIHFEEPALIHFEEPALGHFEEPYLSHFEEP